MERNPFVFGKVVTGDHFCNRVKEIKTLKSYISDGYSVWLYSPRRYGKTSLIHRVFAQTKNVKTVYFDLYNIISVDDFCRKYSQLIARDLFTWKHDVKSLTGKLTKYFKSLYPKVSFDETGHPSLSLESLVIEKQPEVEQILQIPEMIAKENKQKICIAFDEFQEIDRINPFLINWMRSVFQNQQHVSYIFLGSKQDLMRTIFASTHSPFYEFAVKMDIAPISEKDLTEYINKGFKRTGLEISSSNINEIIRISGGHPHFTQYFASVVFDQIRNGADQEDVNFTSIWLNQIIDSQSIIFQNTFDTLNNNQRRVLVAVAQSDENSELFSNELRSKFNLPSSSTLNTTIKGLISRNLIQKDKSVYRLINPIFREWLKQL
jgi:hypothetical protein